MPKNWFLELETSNFGSSHVFWSPLKWWGQILLKMTFRIQKLHILGTIPGKIQVCTIMPKPVFFELQTSNFGSSYVFLSQKK